MIHERRVVGALARRQFDEALFDAYVAQWKPGLWGKLTSLKLEHNEFVVVPESLTRMTALTSLNMSFNRLVSITTVLALTRLEVLNLSNNCLEAIPKELGYRLTRLVSLSLKDNDLECLPRSLARLTLLQRLELNSSHVTGPFGTAQQQIEHIHTFYSRAPREAVSTIMLFRLRKDNVWTTIPKDVALVIAHLIMDSADDAEVWMPVNGPYFKVDCQELILPASQN